MIRILRPILWLAAWIYWIGWCVLGIVGAWLYYAAFRVRDWCNATFRNGKGLHPSPSDSDQS